MKREQAMALWAEASKGAPDGVATGQTIEDFAARVIEVCATRLEAEHVGADVCDDTDNDEDAAYNTALRDAAQALREWAF